MTYSRAGMLRVDSQIVAKTCLPAHFRETSVTPSPLIGLETEFGIQVHGTDAVDSFAASRLLLARCDEGRTGGSVKDEWSLMLPNGGRFYIDHAHPEYSTPESASARDAVVADKAGERLVERCRRRVLDSGDLPSGQLLSLYKNNSDGKGNSYGFHENYLITDSLFDELIRRRSSRLLSALVPFLVTRIILCGAGKVGAENRARETGYQLSQRADFFETLIALQTTYERPLVNSRDEPHATGLARLHVIAGDANLAEYSTFLKVGCLSLLLRLLEDGVELPDFTLQDPLAAISNVSRDLAFNAPLPLRSGGSVTAIEVQQQYLLHASRYSDASDVLRAWDDSLNRLRNDWRLVADRLDWAVKRQVLERYLESMGGDWESARLWAPIVPLAASLTKVKTVSAARRQLLMQAIQQMNAYVMAHHLERSDHPRQHEIYYGLRRLDLEYHDISAGGLFDRLQRAGAVERLLNEDEIERRVASPPPNTRAYLRGMLLGTYSDDVVSADWEEVRIISSAATWRVGLDDPCGGTRDSVGDLFDRQLPLKELLVALEALGLASPDSDPIEYQHENLSTEPH